MIISDRRSGGLAGSDPGRDEALRDLARRLIWWAEPDVALVFDECDRPGLRHEEIGAAHSEVRTQKRFAKHAPSRRRECLGRRIP